MQSDNSRQSRENNKQGNILFCLAHELLMKSLEVEIWRKTKGKIGNWKNTFHELQELANTIGLEISSKKERPNRPCTWARPKLNKIGE